MGKLLSDRTAEWLTDQMQRGNSRTRLRRIMGDGDGGEEGASCVPVTIKGLYDGNTNYTGYQFAIIGKTYRRSNHEFEDEPLFLPHLSQSTEIPEGICVLAHNVATVRMKSSNDD